MSMFLLASPVAGRKPQCNAGAVQQGMYSTIPIHWNIKSAPASQGRSRVGPAFYVFSFLGCTYVHNVAEVISPADMPWGSLCSAAALSLGESPQKLKLFFLDEKEVCSLIRFNFWV
jgi:hypothetical protein